MDNPEIFDFATREANKYFPVKDDNWMAFYMACVQAKRNEEARVYQLEQGYLDRIDKIRDKLRAEIEALQKENRALKNTIADLCPKMSVAVLDDIDVLRILKERIENEQ